jgi:hypothetical protein
MSQSSPMLARPRNLELPNTRLHGWRLIVARAVVFATIACTVLVGLLALPGLVSLLAVPCADAANRCLITPAQVAPLAKLGITTTALAVGVVGLTCLSVLLVDGVAAVVLWRRSDDWMALLVVLDLVLLPTSFTPGLRDLTGFWQTVAQGLSVANFLTLILLVGLFPSGRFVPRWLWLPVLAVASMPHLPFWASIPLPIFLLLLLSLVLFLIASQIYRYRRVSTPMQRQQTKWAVFGIALALLVNQLFWQPAALLSAVQRPDSLYPLLLYPDNFLIIGSLAVSFGVAILRFRLYDIDILIRRTLVYGSLTLVIATLYFSLVLGAQTILGALTGQTGQQPLLIVASTLVIAALFNRLRRHIQAIIDRRFYRAKYDSERTLERFAATLRSEVDLGALREHLVEVVEETMHPAQVGLWLAPHRQAAERRSPISSSIPGDYLTKDISRNPGDNLTY